MWVRSRAPLMAGGARDSRRLNSPPSKALIYMLEHTGFNLPPIQPTILIHNTTFGLDTCTYAEKPSNYVLALVSASGLNAFSSYPLSCHHAILLQGQKLTVRRRLPIIIFC